MIPLKLNKRAAALGCALAIEDGVVYLVELEHKQVIFGGSLEEVAEELTALEEDAGITEEGI